MAHITATHYQEPPFTLPKTKNPMLRAQDFSKLISYDYSSSSSSSSTSGLS
jgi:hypothetical protein